MNNTMHWENIKNAPVSNDPYPHFIVEQSIRLEATSGISQHFPALPFAGLIPPGSLSYGNAFDNLLKDLCSDQLREIISDKLNINLEGLPPLVTIRGRARQRDGRIHTDTKDKKVSLLLYLNDEWPYEEGKLRVLRDGINLDNYTAEISPLMGSLFVFEVTDNCWHGHKPLEAERRAIMLNYMTNENTFQKHQKKHTRSAWFKKIKQYFKN